jgi:hypothetical protein
VVAVSWLEAAGGSGRFDDEETLLLGETMAHELGHYMGLFHPVQFDDSGNIVYFDVLDDTPECNNYEGCLEALAENNMFPYLVCEWVEGCDAQDELTDAQRAVTRRYTGTR